MANQTQPTNADVTAFLDQLDPSRRSDADRLVAMMSAATEESPTMWGQSIIGFGRYRYRYETGREGDSPLASFSPRKTEFSIYLTGVYFPESIERTAELLAHLGRHRMGKACLYVRSLSDIDEAVLRQLVEFSVAELRRHYP
ncbi:MAG: DUF1801 domain-containing protein [Verrucomicrobiaceae bacterium]|nr:MAG: DUF1801 domain-containing protein [Verrucomicrobiaceae bacterium]